MSRNTRGKNIKTTLLFWWRNTYHSTFLYHLFLFIFIPPCYLDKLHPHFYPTWHPRPSCERVKRSPTTNLTKRDRKQHATIISGEGTRLNEVRPSIWPVLWPTSPSGHMLGSPPNRSHTPYLLVFSFFFIYGWKIDKIRYVEILTFWIRKTK